MKINILTLFPEMFAPLNESILGRASGKNIIDINLINIRDYSLDKHKKADDYPYGGGTGMLMSADPIIRAVEETDSAYKSVSNKMVYMSPRGKLLDYQLLKELTGYESLTVLAGHYEGVDERALDYLGFEEYSIGDYVLTGGELPAMVLVDSLTRLLPGVLANEDSREDESIYSGLLEYPQYTKPRLVRGIEVPEVLYSGNHKKIHLWNFEKALELTLERRPDLIKIYFDKNREFDREEKKIIKKVIGDGYEQG